VTEARALTIPPEALVTFAGIEKVFVVVDGLSAEKRVVTGDRGTGWVEVTSGLKEGDRVVLGPGGLQGGQKVRSSEAPAAAVSKSPTPPAGS
jgi:multidrug efflux pump subunit AcrA (membrane-fusion protein)